MKEGEKSNPVASANFAAHLGCTGHAVRVGGGNWQWKCSDGGCKFGGPIDSYGKTGASFVCEHNHTVPRQVFAFGKKRSLYPCQTWPLNEAPEILVTIHDMLINKEKVTAGTVKKLALNRPNITKFGEMSRDEHKKWNAGMGQALRRMRDTVDSWRAEASGGAQRMWLRPKMTPDDLLRSGQEEIAIYEGNPHGGARCAGVWTTADGEEVEVGLVYVADEMLELVAQLLKSKMVEHVGLAISLDGTFRLTDEGFPLLMLVVEDGGGTFHEVGWCICTSERASCVARFITVFRHALWQKCRVELSARSVVKNARTFWAADGGYPLRLGVAEAFRIYANMANVANQPLDELLQVRRAAAALQRTGPGHGPPRLTVSGSLAHI